MHGAFKNLDSLVAARGLSVCMLLHALAGCAVTQSHVSDAPSTPRRTVRFQTQIEFVNDAVARPIDMENGMGKSSDRMSSLGPQESREAAHWQSGGEVEPSAGPYLVQIAAYRSQERARSAWHDLDNRAPLLFKGRVRMVERADVGARGIVYRLRAGYFSDDAAAKAFCRALDFSGDDCMIVRRLGTDR